MDKRFSDHRTQLLIFPLLFFFSRIILSLTLLADNLGGFGDLNTYFDWADSLGWLYFDAWSEYPPVFPFLNKLIYLGAGGNEFLFQFLSVVVFSLAGAAVIYMQGLLAQRLFGQKEGFIRNIVFFGLLSTLSYTWWYFDLIPVLFMLMGLWYLMENQTVKSGIVIGLGILTKWFPMFALVAAFRCQPKKKALRVTLIAVGLTLLVFGILYAVSPVMTSASIKAQFGRNSYQTIWAIIDQNFTTGSVYLVSEQSVAEYSTYRRGNLPVIPTWIPLVIFGILGFLSIYKIKQESDQNLVAVLGITWAFFLLWCPGWSPQWILYLLPLILLSYNRNRAVTLAFCLTLLTVVEWPTLLARQLFEALWVIIPLRMGLLILMITGWVKVLRNPQPVNLEKRDDPLDLFE